MFQTEVLSNPTSFRFIGVSIFLFITAVTSSASQYLQNNCDEESHYYKTFTCDNGECIPSVLVGDGVLDCSDKSDEKKTSAKSSSHVFDVIRNNESSTAEKIQSDYDKYMEPLWGELKDGRLEYMLDYKDKGFLDKYRDFHPKRIVRLLTERAAKLNTMQEVFHEEMRFLVSLDSICSGCSTLYDGKWYVINDYVKKYEFEVEATDPADTITLFRLRLIFPHYHDFGQKLFANPPRIDFPGGFKAPAILERPEFGGLIPRSDHLPLHLGRSREALMYMHLYLLDRNSQETLPLRTNWIIMRQRMEKSILSDDRRIRFLQNNGILTADNKMTFTCDEYNTRNCVDQEALKSIERSLKNKLFPRFS